MKTSSCIMPRNNLKYDKPLKFLEFKNKFMELNDKITNSDGSVTMGDENYKMLANQVFITEVDNGEPVDYIPIGWELIFRSEDDGLYVLCSHRCEYPRVFKTLDSAINTAKDCYAETVDVIL